MNVEHVAIDHSATVVTPFELGIFAFGIALFLTSSKMTRKRNLIFWSLIAFLLGMWLIVLWGYCADRKSS